MCSDMERIIERSKPSWNIKSLTGWRYREEIKAKSWNKNGDVCNYSLNNDLLFLRMSLFFFLTAAAISWHSWSSFFVRFYFLADVFSLVFFSLAMQQKSSFFCKFFLVKETRPPFLKKRNSQIESAFSFMNSAAAAIFHSGLSALSISVFISFWLGHQPIEGEFDFHQFWTWSSTESTSLTVVSVYQSQNKSKLFYFGKFFQCRH
jgi:hypothetical protein